MNNKSLIAMALLIVIIIIILTLHKRSFVNDYHQRHPIISVSPISGSNLSVSGNGSAQVSGSNTQSGSNIIAFPGKINSMSGSDVISLKE